MKTLNNILMALRLKPRPLNFEDYEAALRKFKVNYLAQSRCR